MPSIPFDIHNDLQREKLRAHIDTASHIRSADLKGKADPRSADHMKP